MATPRTNPYIWVTSVTKLMAGEMQCEWASWFRAHHEYNKHVGDPFDSTKWRVEHTAMLRDECDVLRADGFKIYIEDQNKFSFSGKNGVVLGGKPDILAVKGDAGILVDCKSGQQKTSDQVQVMVYMTLLPYVRKSLGVKVWNGRVKYKETTVNISAEDIGPWFKDNFRNVMNKISGLLPLPKVPSFGDCRYCDIGREDCPERVDTEPVSEVIEHDLF